MTTTIGKTVQALLTRTEMTQQQAADALGTSRLTVSQLVNGQRRMTATMALRFQRVFAVKAKDLLEIQMEQDLRSARKVGR